MRAYLLFLPLLHHLDRQYRCESMQLKKLWTDLTSYAPFSYQWSLYLIYQWNLELSYQWHLQHLLKFLPSTFLDKSANYTLTIALDFSVHKPLEQLASIISNNRNVIKDIVICKNRYIISHKKHSKPFEGRSYLEGQINPNKRKVRSMMQRHSP